MNNKEQISIQRFSLVGLQDSSLVGNFSLARLD